MGPVFVLFLSLVLFVVDAVGSSPPLSGGFNNPPGVPIWCGKAYRPQDASFPPGGRLERPQQREQLLLDLRVRPRLSFYTPKDPQASLIVDAALSKLTGFDIDGPSHHHYNGSTTVAGSDKLSIEARMQDGPTLLRNRVVASNSTGNTFNFGLRSIKPSFTPYNILLTATSPRTGQTFRVSTSLHYLPSSTLGGTEIRLDSLHGSILVPDSGSPRGESPLFPYSYYTSWSGYLENSPSNVTSFKEQGYNIVHVVPDASLEYGFNFTEFNAFLDTTDDIGLWVMYDMRYTYQNSTAVRYQVDQLKRRKSLLLYYTGDEPDGNGDPVDAPKHAYDLIKSIDPYHPVSLCLNCDNFHYAEYAAGADVVMEDVYPVSVNASYSEVYGTVCNATYGCCGCDDCAGDFADISARLDRLAEYQSWTGGPPKPLWGVPQAFGASQFWSREPTAAEVAVMSALSLNHGAKGLVSWTYPTAPEIERETGKLARLLSTREITEFTLGVTGVKLKVSSTSRNDGGEQQAAAASAVEAVDATAWVLGNGTALVSVVNTAHKAIAGPLSISGLPSRREAVKVGGKRTASSGSTTTSYLGSPWRLTRSGGGGGGGSSDGMLLLLSKTMGMAGLECDLFAVDLAG